MDKPPERKTAAQLLDNDINNRIEVALADEFIAIFEKGIATDVVLVAGKREFRCHKFILAARSPVFAAMFSHDMMESKEGRVEITDIEPFVCEHMLRHIYSGRNFDLEPHAKELFIAADKYGLSNLKEITENWIRCAMTFDDCVELLEMSDMYNASSLKVAVLTFITRYAHVVHPTKVFKDLFVKNPKLGFDLYCDLSSRNRPSPPMPPSHYRMMDPSAFIVRPLCMAPMPGEDRGRDPRSRMTPRSLRRMLHLLDDDDEMDMDMAPPGGGRRGGS